MPNDNDRDLTAAGEDQTTAAESPAPEDNSAQAVATEAITRTTKPLL